MNPKEVFHNTTYSVQLPVIAGHSTFKSSWITYKHHSNYRLFLILALNENIQFFRMIYSHANKLILRAATSNFLILISLQPDILNKDYLINQDSQFGISKVYDIGLQRSRDQILWQKPKIHQYRLFIRTVFSNKSNLFSKSQKNILFNISRRDLILSFGQITLHRSII